MSDSGGNLPATAISNVSPSRVVKEALLALPEVEQVFISDTGNNHFSVLTVIGEVNYDAQKEIFLAEAQILKALKGINIGFELVIRDGRPLQQLLAPNISW